MLAFKGNERNKLVGGDRNYSYGHTPQLAGIAKPGSKLLAQLAPIY